MKTSNFRIVMALALLVINSLACNAVMGGPQIVNAYTADPNDYSRVKMVFAPTEPLPVVVKFENTPPETVVKVVWTAVNVENWSPNTYINEYSESLGDDGEVAYWLNPDEGYPWGVGRYKADIYVNDELKETLEMEVR